MINFIKKEIENSGGIENYLHTQLYKTLLRFMTCGSVDDGKSTLIGRLLHDTQQIYEDQLSVLKVDSKKIGTQQNKLDLALLVDGLQSERMQGITIDVAYRYFATKKRKFIIADTPGHEEYTKNMATGASTSELAILLIDARKGIRKQTRRHWLISTILGIKHFIVVVNKMDLVNYDQNIFENICKEYCEFTANFSPDCNTQFVPISALDGDNVTTFSENMRWYDGLTLLNVLENINVHLNINLDKQEFRFPVQYVMHYMGFRGYLGTVASGNMYVGQRIRVFPSQMTSCIKRIVTFKKDQEYAYSGESVTITLSDDIDIDRGNILTEVCSSIAPVGAALVDVIWMNTRSLKPGQFFNIKIANKILRAKIDNIEYQIDIHTFMHKSVDKIPINGIGLVKLSFDELLILDEYSYYPITGSMIFIDLLSNETVGAGMVRTPILECSKSKYLQHHSTFELELYSLIRRHFPHWKNF